VMLGVLAVVVWWFARAVRRRQLEPVHLAALFLLTTAGLVCVASVLGDGLCEIARHTVGARLCVDLVIVVAAHRLVVWLASLRSRDHQRQRGATFELGDPGIERSRPPNVTAGRRTQVR
jgi:hypothetical protein